MHRILIATLALAGCLPALPRPGASSRAAAPAFGAAAREGAPPHAFAWVYGPFLDAAKKRGFALTPDQALEAGALAWADTLDPDHATTDSDDLLRAQITERAGVVDHTVYSTVVRHASEAAFDDGLAEKILAQLDASDGPEVAVGLGWQEERDGFMTVLFAPRGAVLDAPIAQRVTAGTKQRVRGHLTGEWRDPVLVVAPPDGPVEVTELAKGNAFDTELELPRAGAWRFEITASNRYGPRPQVNAPVWVDVAPADVPPPLATYRGDAATAAKELFRLVNTLRAQRGLAPVAYDERLAQVGRGHCDDQLAHHFIGHVSPTTGGPDDRVRAAGLKPAGVGENIATAAGPEGGHEGLSRSPAHLGVMLDPAFTHLGVGAVPGRAASDPPWCFVEVFAEWPQPIDVDARAKKLGDDAQKALAKAGGRCPPDPALAAAATGIAKRAFAEKKKPEQVWRGAPELNRLAYARFTLAAFSGPRTPEAADVARAFPPDAAACAVGVAQGTLPGGAENELVTLVLAAYEPLPDAGSSSVRETLRRGMAARANELRAAKGLGAIELDTALSDVADRALGGGGSDERTVSLASTAARANHAFDKFTLRTALYESNDPVRRVAELDLFADPKLKRAGIGFRRATRDGAPAIAVLVVGASQ